LGEAGKVSNNSPQGQEANWNGFRQQHHIKATASHAKQNEMKQTYPALITGL